MASLEVGLKPGPLTFHYVVGDGMTFSMTLFDLSDPPEAVAWPEAPVLRFGSGDEEITKASVLSAEGLVADAKATWTFTNLEILAIDELADAYAAVVVSDMSWWVGKTNRNG